MPPWYERCHGLGIGCRTAAAPPVIWKHKAKAALGIIPDFRDHVHFNRVLPSFLRHTTADRSRITGHSVHQEIAYSSSVRITGHSVHKEIPYSSVRKNNKAKRDEAETRTGKRKKEGRKL